MSKFYNRSFHVILIIQLKLKNSNQLIFGHLSIDLFCTVYSQIGKGIHYCR